MTRRAPLALVGVVGVFCVLSELSRAVGVGMPAREIPTFDIADYVVRAQDWRTAWLGDLEAIRGLLLTPDPHPALHPAGLGLALAFLGDSPRIESAWALALVAAGAAVLVGLGTRPDGWLGGVVGALAAGATSLGLLHESMVTSPMTEPAAALAMGVALCSWPRNGARSAAWLGLGGLVLLAGGVRYNLLPTLLVAAAATICLRPPGTRLADLLALTAPAGVLAAAVAVWAPEYMLGLRRFFTNVDSGIPALSVANLSWFGGAWVRQVFGRVDVALVAAALAVASVVVRLRVRAANHPAELPVALFVLVGLGSLLVHPFKLDRNLYVFIGPTWLLVLAPLVRVATTPARAWALAAGAVIGLYGYHRSTEGLQTEQYYYEDRHVRHALEAATAAATEADRVVLVGAHRDLSAAVFTYWLRRHGFGGEVTEQEEYPPSCGTPAGADGPLCHPLQVGRYADERGVVFVTVDALDAGGGRRAWRTAAWQETADWLDARRYRYDELSLREQGLRVRVYR